MFFRLREIILKNAGRFQSKNEAVLLEVHSFWNDVVLDLPVLKKVIPHSFRKGTLVLACGSSVEASSLNLIKERVKKELNTKLGTEDVKSIRVLVIKR